MVIAAMKLKDAYSLDHYLVIIPDWELRSHMPQGVASPQKEEEIYEIDMAIKNYKYMGLPWWHSR